MAATGNDFICVWLDGSVDATEANNKIQKKLCQIIENLRTFDNVEVCEKYLRKTTKESLILIVSGTFGRQILPSIHDLPQLISFYVFCQDKKGNEQWATKYSKVNNHRRKIFHFLDFSSVVFARRMSN